MRQTTAKVASAGAHRDVGAVGGDVAQRAARAVVRAAHQERGEQHRQRRHGQPAGEAAEHLRSDVAGPLRIGVGEVRAAELQPGEVAHRFAVAHHRLLDEAL